MRDSLWVHSGWLGAPSHHPLSPVIKLSIRHPRKKDKKEAQTLKASKWTLLTLPSIPVFDRICTGVQLISAGLETCVNMYMCYLHCIRRHCRESRPVEGHFRHRKFFDTSTWHLHKYSTPRHIWRDWVIARLGSTEDFWFAVDQNELSRFSDIVQ